MQSFSILLHPFRIQQIDLHLGTTDDIQLHADVGLALLAADNVALQALQAATDDAHLVAQVDGHRLDADGVVGVIEHELQALYLVGGDGGQGVTGKRVDLTGTIGHKTKDIREFHHLFPLGFGGTKEDQGGEDYALYGSAPSLGSNAFLGLRGDIGFIPQTLQLLAAFLLAVVIDDGDEPTTGWHAYGVVSDLLHRRSATCFHGIF